MKAKDILRSLALKGMSNNHIRVTSQHKGHNTFPFRAGAADDVHSRTTRARTSPVRSSIFSIVINLHVCRLHAANTAGGCQSERDIESPF